MRHHANKSWSKVEEFGGSQVEEVPGKMKVRLGIQLGLFAYLLVVCEHARPREKTDSSMQVVGSLDDAITKAHNGKTSQCECCLILVAIKILRALLHIQEPDNQLLPPN